MKYIFSIIDKFFAVNDWLKIQYRNYRFYHQNPQRKLIRRQFSKFWKSYSSSLNWDGKSVVICEYQPNIFLGFGVAILANIIAKVKWARVIYFNPIPLGQKAWFLSVFPNQIYSNYHSNIVDRNDLINEEVELIYENLNTPKDILSIEYKGVNIGSFIYDEIQRSEKGWKASVWEVNDEVKLFIRKALVVIHGLKDIQFNYQIKSAVFTHSIGIHAGGLALTYLLHKNVEVYCGRVGLRTIKKYNRKISHDWILPLMDPDARIIEKLVLPENKNKVLKRAEDYLAQRFGGFQKDSDSSRAFAKDRVMYETDEDFINYHNLPRAKPLVFVMLHAFNDFPHHFKNNLFLDYYRWFIHTLKIAQMNDSVNWVFKAHPSSIHYPDDANLEGIFEIERSKNILFLDRRVKFNTLSLKNIASCIITCVGTAGLEFSTFGIPVILGGENYYSKFGIGELPATIQEYDDLLLNLGKTELVKPDKDKIELAKILFYVVFRFLAIDTPINDRFIPFHNIDIAKSSNSDNYVIDKILSEINDPTIKDYIGSIENFIKDDARHDLLDFDDVMNDIKLDIANFANSIISA